MYRSGTVMAWNVFKFCTALRGLGSIMILLVLGVVGVTYYAVVITNYAPALTDGDLDSLVAVFVLISFHFLVIHLTRTLEIVYISFQFIFCARVIEFAHMVQNFFVLILL